MADQTIEPLVRNSTTDAPLAQCIQAEMLSGTMHKVTIAMPQ